MVCHVKRTTGARRCRSQSPVAWPSRWSPCWRSSEPEARSPHPATARAPPPRAAPVRAAPAPGGARADFATAVASYLGITKAELKTARDNGTSLAQFATQQGKTVSGLKAAIYADAQAHLDKEVAAGKLTTAQEASMLASLQSRLDDMVNATGPPPLGPPPAA